MKGNLPFTKGLFRNLMFIVVLCVCVCAKLLSHAQVKQEDLDEVNFQIIIFSYNGSNTATIKF